MHNEVYKKHLKSEWEIKQEANNDEDEEILSNSDYDCKTHLMVVTLY